MRRDKRPTLDEFRRLLRTKLAPSHHRDELVLLVDDMHDRLRDETARAAGRRGRSDQGGAEGATGHVIRCLRSWFLREELVG